MAQDRILEYAQKLYNEVQRHQKAAQEALNKGEEGYSAYLMHRHYVHAEIDSLDMYYKIVLSDKKYHTQAKRVKQMLDEHAEIERKKVSQILNGPENGN